MPRVCTIAWCSSSRAARLPKFTPLNLFTLNMCNAEEIWCRTASKEEKRCRAELDNHRSIRSVLGSSNGRSSGKNGNDVGGSSSSGSSKSGSKGYFATTDYRQGNDSTLFFKECWEAARDLPAAGVLRTALTGGWAKEEKRQQELMQQLEFTVERNKALERLIGAPSSQDMELISMRQFELSKPVHSECGREGLYRSG